MKERNTVIFFGRILPMPFDPAMMARRLLPGEFWNAPHAINQRLCKNGADYTFDYEDGATIYAAETTMLYPKTSVKTLPTDLPPKIAEEYEAALQVQHISLNACAVLLRRTLEAIFNHEKAQGKTLEQKVDYLLRSANIPPLLAEMAHLGRHIGNLGAHVDADEVTEEDVTVLLNFIEVIFVYLYTTPTKVLAFKERLKKTP